MNYKEDQVAGYQRVYGGTFSNPKGGIPSITFNEEISITVGAESFTRPCSSVSTELTDPQKVLQLRNPLDDSIIGAGTYQDVYVMLYSLGRQAQTERDVYANI